MDLLYYMINEKGMMHKLQKLYYLRLHPYYMGDEMGQTCSLIHSQQITKQKTLRKGWADSMHAK